MNYTPMKTKMPITSLSIALGVLFFSSLALGSPLSQFQEVTPTPTATKALATALGGQAGSTDWIALLGVLIFVVILVPIMLVSRKWKLK